MDGIDLLFDRTPWPNQSYGVTKAIESIEAKQSCCVTSPTGSGKSVMQVALIRWCAQTGRRVILYTNRIMLTDQTMRVLDAHNVEYGVIAATQKDRMALLRDVQLASIQTVNARVNRTKRSELWKADVVLIDEAHVLCNGSSEKILRAHEEHGGVLVGFTATPLGLSHLYPHLIIAARNSDCRKFGALVPAKVYAPCEFDTSSLKLQDNGEFSYEDIKKTIYTPKLRNAIFGYVHDHWRRLNPDALPALGFAPGVAEAKWFVDQFAERGVRCASIDGEDCYIDGEEHKTSQGLRQEIVEEAKQGKVAIIWNRFVLREGIDFPWLHHLILATPIGSLTSYVQVVGRVLRFSEQTPSFVIIQDHGSSWWRHGSPNQDWDWERWYCANPSLPSRVRADAIRERREETAIVCHKCGLVRSSGLLCPRCGTQMNKKRRAVIQKDGTLKEMYGEPLPRKYVKEEPDTYSKWKSMVHRMRNADLTFAQAEGLFANENHYWPPPDLPMMPKLRVDKFQKIKKIPVDKLISVDEHVSMRVEAGKEPAKGVIERFKQERLF